MWAGGVRVVVTNNDGKILLVKQKHETKEIWMLPGGTVEDDETSQDAAIREVLEETGYSVKVLSFAVLLEEIYDNKEVREKSFEYSHRIIYVFKVSLLSETPAKCSEKDFQQEDTRGVSLDEIDEMVFRPSQLTGRIRSIIEADTPQYFGSVRIP